jgi:hypothetical protein
MGPTFTLHLFDTGKTDEYGKSILAYRLTQSDTIFEGADYHCSPMNAIDSDESVAGLMGFLTLRPGDTDEDYFADYTPKQLAFLGHAEALGAEVYARFGEN